MRPTDYLAEALGNILSAKLRSLLTSLGIIIGVAAVVLMISLGQGISTTITQTFSDLGATRITVVSSAPRPAGAGGFGRGGGGFSGGIASTLTLEDAAALSQIGEVEAAAPVIQVPARVSTPARTLNLAATGTTAAYREATQQTLAEGRLFEDAGEVVVNQAAAENLFADGAVGETLTINDQEFAVVGVFADQPTPFGGGPGNDQVAPALFMPVEEALAMAGTRHVAQIELTAATPELVEAAQESARAILLERHDGVEDFTVISFQQLTESFTQIFDVFTLFLAAIAGISLVVGGIGIMNIMLVTVTERTREIGIAKALGATRGQVTGQFLVEAVLLSLLGGILGLLLAWLGTVVLNQTLELPAIITASAISLALGVSVAIGVFFGVVPAWRAARLDPIVALRYG